MSERVGRTICLFDVDGTITNPRQSITPDMQQFLQALRRKVSVGLVGGSDLDKIVEQMNAGGQSSPQSGRDILAKYDYVFAENGLVAYREGSLVEKQSILNYMGEEKLQTFINYCLRYMSELKLPAKRGNFVEFRNGLINICPVGRSCSQREREQFAHFDSLHKIRQKFVDSLNEKFGDDFGLVYAIGGQISFDSFPKGWDKTYCLKFIEKDFEKIYFFGDKTFQGGNDYEIYEDSRTIGYHVNSPEDTKQIVTQLFF